jgi:hypothetical protein
MKTIGGKIDPLVEGLKKEFPKVEKKGDDKKKSAADDKQ